MKMSQHNTGFTLMEMVILMAIIAIIAAVAMPNAGGYIDNNRMSAAASDMTAALQAGRSESVGRNSAITLCTSNSTAISITSGTCRPRFFPWASPRKWRRTANG